MRPPLDPPLRWTAQSTLHCLPLSPGRPVHSDTNSASPGSILAMQQLRAKAKSLTFPPLYIPKYSFLQLSELGHQWRERMCPIFETVAKGDSNPGSLHCESGILPLSYRTPECHAIQVLLLAPLKHSSLPRWVSDWTVIVSKATADELIRSCQAQ